MARLQELVGAIALPTAFVSESVPCKYVYDALGPCHSSSVATASVLDIEQDAACI